MPMDLMTTAPAIDGCLTACKRSLDAVDFFCRAGGAYSAIGPHLRHCLDHLVCFLRGLEAGVIEYDARDRDPLIETDASHFCALTQKAMQQLAAIDPEAMGRVIQVVQISAPGQEPSPVQSTVERELVFLSGHTIHHLAIIAFIAKGLGIDIPADLCVAFSTAAYRAGLDNR